MFSYNEIKKTLSVDKIPELLGIPFEYIKMLIIKIKNSTTRPKQVFLYSYP